MPPFPEKYIVPGLEAKARKYSRAMTILFPFCLLILPAIPWMVLSVKASRYTQLLRITQFVKQQEKVPLVSVFGFTPNAAAVAQMLIDTGNLAGYRLAGGVLLVKDGIEMSDEEAKAECARLYGAYPAAMGMAVRTAASAQVPAAPAQVPAAETPAQAPASETPAQVPAAPADGTPAAFCTQCGAPLPEDAAFCPRCGKKRA